MLEGQSICQEQQQPEERTNSKKQTLSKNQSMPDKHTLLKEQNLPEKQNVLDAQPVPEDQNNVDNLQTEGVHVNALPDSHSTTSDIVAEVSQAPDSSEESAGHTRTSSDPSVCAVNTPSNRSYENSSSNPVSSPSNSSAVRSANSHSDISPVTVIEDACDSLTDSSYDSSSVCSAESSSNCFTNRVENSETSTDRFDSHSDSSSNRIDSLSDDSTDVSDSTSDNQSNSSTSAHQGDSGLVADLFSSAWLWRYPTESNIPQTRRTWKLACYHHFYALKDGPPCYLCSMSDNPPKYHKTEKSGWWKVRKNIKLTFHSLRSLVLYHHAQTHDVRDTSIRPFSISNGYFGYFSRNTTHSSSTDTCTIEELPDPPGYYVSENEEVRMDVTEYTSRARLSSGNWNQPPLSYQESNIYAPRQLTSCVSQRESTLVVPVSGIHHQPNDQSGYRYHNPSSGHVNFAYMCSENDHQCNIVSCGQHSPSSLPAAYEVPLSNIHLGYQQHNRSCDQRAADVYSGSVSVSETLCHADELHDCGQRDPSSHHICTYCTTGDTSEVRHQVVGTRHHEQQILPLDHQEVLNMCPLDNVSEVTHESNEQPCTHLSSPHASSPVCHSDQIMQRSDSCTVVMQHPRTDLYYPSSNTEAHSEVPPPYAPPNPASPIFHYAHQSQEQDQRRRDKICSRRV